jgi:hypothetical protein
MLHSFPHSRGVCALCARCGVCGGQVDDLMLFFEQLDSSGEGVLDWVEFKAALIELDLTLPVKEVRPPHMRMRTTCPFEYTHAYGHAPPLGWVPASKHWRVQVAWPLWPSVRACVCVDAAWPVAAHPTRVYIHGQRET